MPILCSSTDKLNILSVFQTYLIVTTYPRSYPQIVIDSIMAGETKDVTEFMSRHFHEGPIAKKVVFFPNLTKISP